MNDPIAFNKLILLQLQQQLAIKVTSFWHATSRTTRESMPDRWLNWTQSRLIGCSVDKTSLDQKSNDTFQFNFFEIQFQRKKIDSSFFFAFRPSLEELLLLVGFKVDFDSCTSLKINLTRLWSLQSRIVFVKLKKGKEVTLTTHPQGLCS